MQRHQIVLENLKDEFYNHSIPMEKYEEEIIPKIVTSIWATEPQSYLELLKVERARLPKGKVLKSEPIEKKNCFRINFNAKGQLIYLEEYGNHPLHGYKKFYQYSDSLIQTFQFKKDGGQLEKIEFQELENNRPIWFGEFEEGKGNTIDYYEYEKERLTQIQSLWVYGKSTVQFPLYQINYDKLENIEQIVRVDAVSAHFPKGQNCVVYKQNKYSLNTLSKILTQEIVNRIQQDLEKITTENCLLIFTQNTFNSDNWFPPNYSFINNQNTLNEAIEVSDFFDFNKVQSINSIVKNEKLEAVAQLLMQEIELKEKYELPSKILLKIGKAIKSWIDENRTNLNLPDGFKIFVLDFPDDYYENAISILKQLYSQKEIKKFD